MRTTLVTGGAGFIGANLVRTLLAEQPDRAVVNLDRLTYAGHRSTLADVLDHPRHKLVVADVADAAAVDAVLRGADFDQIYHLAAESHVDRSIADAAPFLHTNVQGTQVLLDAARRHGVARVVHVSTDEVYGHLGDQDPPFTEDSPLRPRSPYAASKAAADHLCHAAFVTHGVPVVITRCSNNLGPWQLPEKLIPRMVACVLDGQPLPVYGTGGNIRDWIAVDDHCRGLMAAMAAGRPGRVYNLGAACERTNLAVIDAVCAHLGRPDAPRAFVADRPGHDWRYALDARRAQVELGWRPRRSFDAALAETIAWYAAHEAWWRPLLAHAARPVARLAPDGADG